MSDSGVRRGPTLLNGTEVHRVLQAEMLHLTTPSLLLSVLHHPVHRTMMVHVYAPLQIVKSVGHCHMHSMNHISKHLCILHTRIQSAFQVSSPIHTLDTAIFHVIIVREWQFLPHASTIVIHVNCFNHTQCAVCKCDKKACNHSTVCDAPIADLTQLP